MHVSADDKFCWEFGEDNFAEKNKTNVIVKIYV